MPMGQIIINIMGQIPWEKLLIIPWANTMGQIIYL